MNLTIALYIIADAMFLGALLILIFCRVIEGKPSILEMWRRKP